MTTPPSRPWAGMAMKWAPSTSTRGRKWIEAGLCRGGEEVEWAGGHLLRYLQRSDEGPWPNLEEMSDRPLCSEDRAETWTMNVNSTRQRRAGTVLLAGGSA